MSTAAWIVIAVVVVLVVLAVAFFAMRRSQSAQRTKAHELRDDAVERGAAVDQREAEAREVAARAQMAKAEADAKAAEAARLESVAQQQQAYAADSRGDVDEQLQQADRLDPDIDTPDTDAAAASDADVEADRGFNAAPDRDGDTGPEPRRTE
jgi:FtsZ-interacting cell division protein ZipA